jgi:4-hydroxybenzoate polyprenyltransferase
MVILAGMVAGWYLSGLGAQLNNLAQSAEGREENTPREFDPHEKGLITFSTVYWILAFLLLLGIGYIALLDLWAVRRYGLRHIRQIQADRRDMLERQFALRRTDRNGHQN